ncbi:hypothetical protein BG53_02235 [Paenibacillus darwinianus]|uniref:Uncharacterized protein n=2 Tax=Paenibacillus darwinianus TaxID=1380763 RepID=A0A9W5W720_9BACL|nr:hypothetical protein BG52_08190 [Paenibacillus darwinianus]EXX88316.1 hypothetical protein BG53_02235 [Paenibacillus darwinianus]EXX89849.1 hypothetical protein CH50_00750 [Paenibacillus darwinianus]
MQIYGPLQPNDPFEQTRQVNKFVAEYILQQMPEKVTLERAGWPLLIRCAPASRDRVDTGKMTGNTGRHSSP